MLILTDRGSDPAKGGSPRFPGSSRKSRLPTLEGDSQFARNDTRVWKQIDFIALAVCANTRFVISLLKLLVYRSGPVTYMSISCRR
jgi:hypothetical protein